MKHDLYFCIVRSFISQDIKHSQKVCYKKNKQNYICFSDDDTVAGQIQYGLLNLYKKQL